MKLDEMGMVGREVKIKDDAPEHAGQVGSILNFTTDRAYVQFNAGVRAWISNKFISGSRKPAHEHREDDAPVLTEMAAKKTCEHCGRTMAANHYWYKGGWKCKKSKEDDKEEEHKPVEDKPGAREFVPKDANDKAAYERSVKFHAEMEREMAKRKEKAK